MKFYFAPMEGITGHIYRNAYQMHFCKMDNYGIDKYFTPFISPNQNRCLSPREIKGVLPENNKEMYVVPQILTNKSQLFVQTAKELKEYGYDEVNLNLGCPSRTVVTKKKGAGFLAYTEELDCFLAEVFETCDAKISIKTRIGRDDPKECYELIEIFNKYPLHELIIHPRIQADYYKNKPNKQIFAEAVRLSKHKLCYNGDIFTKERYEEIREAFSEVNTVMLGRGLLFNPGLIREVEGYGKIENNTLKAFHDEIYRGYYKELSGDKNVLFKMKELWFYMISMFSEHEKYLKKIKKANRLNEYEEIIKELFEQREIK